MNAVAINEPGNTSQIITTQRQGPRTSRSPMNQSPTSPPLSSASDNTNSDNHRPLNPSVPTAQVTSVSSTRARKTQVQGRISRRDEVRSVHRITYTSGNRISHTRSTMCQ